VDITGDDSTVHSTAGVCLVCVTLRLCMCLTKSQASLSGTMTAQENRMQVATQNNQMYTDIFWLSFYYKGTKDSLKFEHLERMHSWCSSVS